MPGNYLLSYTMYRSSVRLQYLFPPFIRNKHTIDTMCVDYCVFSIYKSYGHDMHRIVCAFTNIIMINDCLVDRFVRN